METRIREEEAMVRFERCEEEASFLSPLRDYGVDVQRIEARIDPLTGFVSFVRRGRQFWAGMYRTDEEVLRRLAKETEANCVFCPQRIDKSTPKFLPEFIEEGRVKRGEATLFPNLFPHKACSAIVVVTESHFLRLKEFSEKMLFDAFMLADYFVRRAYELKGLEYAEIGANFLYTSGSSIVHPHIQVILSKVPYTLIKLYEEKGRSFYEREGVNFWHALIGKERELKERFIGEIGSVVFYTPFAPVREDEVDGVVKGKSNFLEFSEDDWMDIAKGISRVLHAYDDKGLSAFNYALFSGPLGKESPHLLSGLKIVSRSSVQTYPVSETWFANCLLFEGLAVEPPEDVASYMKSYLLPLKGRPEKEAYYY